MKNEVGNVVTDADSMKDMWRKYMEKLLNVENDWDGDVDCPEVMGPCCLISEEEVAATIKELKIGKDWRKSIQVPVYKGKGDPLVCGSYRAIKLLEQPMKVVESVGKKII